jgi:hypothetical protein
MSCLKHWSIVLLVLSIGSEIKADARSWTIGSAVAWESERLISTATDFNEGSIELLGFRSDDNIVGQLNWKDSVPLGFIKERPTAHIWDNAALKDTNVPLIDGDSNTSSEERFKRFGVSQEGQAFFLDLGTRIPANRIAFFPRLEGVDQEGRPYREDFIRSYDLAVNAGTSFNQDDVPIYSFLSRVDFTSDPLSETVFPLQFIRYLRLRVNSSNPFELAEVQIYGTGFAPVGRFLSKVIDLGERANFSHLSWAVEYLRQLDDVAQVVNESTGRISVRMRTGLDDSPQVYFKIANLFTREREVVSEAEYNSLTAVEKGPIEDDQTEWSTWSAPFTESGQQINLPSPRQFFQFEVKMESEEILEGIRINSLSVEHSIPPLAQQTVGEISQLDDPQPFGNVPILAAGNQSVLAYDLIADVASGDVGFDAIRIFTPSKPGFRELFIGNPPVSVIPDQISEEDGSLTLHFPAQRIDSRDQLRVIFDTRVFVQGTFFEAEVFDTQSTEPAQRVLPGDANPEVLTNSIRVLTNAESARGILPEFAIEPVVFSPNRDDINDQAAINYTLVQLVRSVEVKVEIFDLAGRKLRTLFDGSKGSGVYTELWNARDDFDVLLPVGLYVAKVEAKTERGNFVRIATIGVVY